MNDEKKTKAQLIEEIAALREAVARLETAEVGHSTLEQALRSHEQSLHATLDSTADGILAVDENGRVIFANKRFAKMWHIPPDLTEAGDDEELLAFVLDQIKDPQTFLSRVRELYQSLRDEIDTLRFKDGRIFERFSRPLVREDRLAGRVWSFRDVTEHMRADEALRESEQLRKAVIEACPAAIIVTDLNGLICDASRRAAGLLAYDTDAPVTGRHFREFVAPDCRELLQRVLREAASKGAVREVSLSMAAKDGEAISAAVNIDLVKDLRGRPRVLVISIEPNR
jgi:PAS domain S-box-containing protein